MDFLKSIVFQWRAILAAPLVALSILALYRDEGPQDSQPPVGYEIGGWLPWEIWLIGVMLFVLWLTFEASYRRIRSLTPILPKNRDALIGAMTAFENSALDLVLEHRAIFLTKESGVATIDRTELTEKFNAYIDARRALEAQVRVAGAAFALGLESYIHIAGGEATRFHFAYADDYQGLTRGDFGDARSKIAQVTAQFLSQIDNGALAELGALEAKR